MKNSSHPYRRQALGLLIVVLSLFLTLFLGGVYFLRPPSVQAGSISLSPDHPQVHAAMAVQHRHSPHLMSLPGVVGTAVGLTDRGRPAVLVFTHDEVGPGGLPEDLEGVPVVVKVTGRIFAMGKRPRGGESVNPRSWFTRPVPIGVSAGNEGECSAGTIGARVKKVVDEKEKVYALGSNHVFALGSDGDPPPDILPSKILQPGLQDTGCVTDPSNSIGSLVDFEPIKFYNKTVTPADYNYIDAAIALSSTAWLDNATPANGYGTPSSETIPTPPQILPGAEMLGRKVQKYGRETALTKGSITGIGAWIDVTYSSGTARFVDQLVIIGKSTIFEPGDSGALVVTADDNANPVGLAFAADSKGRWLWANPINAVLDRFGVTIDGK